MGNDYWSGLSGWLRETMLVEGMISPEDLDIIHIVDSKEEVLKEIVRIRDADQEG